MQFSCDTESLVHCKNQLFLIQHVLADIVFSTFQGVCGVLCCAVLERLAPSYMQSHCVHSKLLATRIGSFTPCTVPTVPYCMVCITLYNSIHWQIRTHTSVGPWWITWGVVMDGRVARHLIVTWSPCHPIEKYLCKGHSVIMPTPACGTLCRHRFTTNFASSATEI